MIRLGVFGGRFDPPHVAHFIHARLILETLELDKILFIPAAAPPHKDARASFDDRFWMVKSAIDGVKEFEISDIERKENLSYTADTLSKLKAIYEDTKLFLILGRDEYDDFDTWHESERIKEMAALVVLPRGVKEDAKPDACGVCFPRLPLIEISSSLIRKRIAQGKSIRHWVPDKVEAYINEKQLYKEST